MPDLQENPTKTVTIFYHGHELTGRILSVHERSVVFRIDLPGCRNMILDRERVELEPSGNQK